MTDKNKPPILVSARMLAPLADELEADYTVHRLWQIDDRDGWLTGDGFDCRVIVGVGEDLPDFEFIRHMSNLGLIACSSTGYEQVPLAWCRSRGIAVCHGRSANAPDVAEHAVGLILAHWRNIVRGDALVRSGRWKPETRLRSHALRGHSVGIVGLGAIGEATARLLEPFGVQIAWWAPRDKEADWPRAETLLDLAQVSNVLVVAARADKSSRGLISREVIAALGRDGLLVNVSRGSVVDQPALVEALREGRLGGAALDVFDPEPTDPDIWEGVPGALLTPHIAGATFEARDALWSLLEENLARFYAGLPLASPL